MALLGQTRDVLAGLFASRQIRRKDLFGGKTFYIEEVVVPIIALTMSSLPKQKNIYVIFHEWASLLTFARMLAKLV